ncbi:MAG: transposase [Gemmataceae bacterium]
MIALFTEAVHLRNEYHRGHATLEHLENQREVFDDRLRKLASVPRAVPAYQTFANHLMNHFEQWFAFVVEPKIEPTNWKAEQAIRPAVVNRKVWGGNRTAAGAKAQSVLMSVIETARRHTRSVIDHFAETLRNFGNTLVPRPVLLPVR